MNNPCDKIIKQFATLSFFLICTLFISTSPAQTSIKLFPQKTAQTIEGFGASAAWWSQIIGAWPESKQNRILELLYGKTGAAMTIYRYNIGAGSGPDIRDPWRSAQTFQTAPGQYDFSRDANAVNIMRKACKLGVQRVILFANSPPVTMTKSHRAYATDDKDLSNLRPDMYDDFANYLADIAQHFIDDPDIPVHSLSPVNEPQWEWNRNNQEGCHYSPDQTARIIELTIRECRRRNLDIEIEAPESASWEKTDEIQSKNPRTSPVYLDTLFANPYIRKNIDAYALHSYWAKKPQKEAFAEYFFKNYPEKKIHMTEWCQMRSRRDYGMDSAIALANEITDDLNLGVSSWQYWIAVSRYNYRDGLIYVNTREKQVIPIKRLWAMANFSRFIRPGSKRIHTESDSTDLNLIAAITPDSKTITAVITNPTETPLTATITIVGASTLKTCTAYETSNANDLKQLPAQQKTPHTFPQKSITSLVFQ